MMIPDGYYADKEFEGAEEKYGLRSPEYQQMAIAHKHGVSKDKAKELQETCSDDFIADACDLFSLRYMNQSVPIEIKFDLYHSLTRCRDAIAKANGCSLFDAIEKRQELMGLGTSANPNSTMQDFADAVASIPDTIEQIK